jgi:hypothetical protein
MHSVQVLIKLEDQTVGGPQTRRAFWRIGNPLLSTQEVQKPMQRASTNTKTAEYGRGAMTAGQMLLEKPLDME